MTTPKRKRAQLAKSELWLAAAMWAQRWADMCRDDSPGMAPMAEWPDDDPLRTLGRTYGLTGEDLAKIWERMAQELENRAVRAGYDDAWVGVEEDWFDVR